MKVQAFFIKLMFFLNNPKRGLDYISVFLANLKSSLSLISLVDYPRNNTALYYFHFGNKFSVGML